MHYFAISRPQFYGLHPMTFREIRWHCEVNIFVNGCPFQYMILANIKDHVRFADVPTINVGRRLRQVARISFFSALIDPVGNNLSFGFA